MAEILAWADAYFARRGSWPKVLSGKVRGGPPGLNWRKVDGALFYGLRGLPGGSSLAKLLAEHRAVRNRCALPPLTEDMIAGWIEAYPDRHGYWPKQTSGLIEDAPGETWRGVDAALRDGFRSLPGGSSVVQLAARRFGVGTLSGLPKLTKSQILQWADEHIRITGRRPDPQSGDVPGRARQTWKSVDGALRYGCRGLKVGDSLYRLLQRNRRIPAGPRRRRETR